MRIEETRGLMQGADAEERSRKSLILQFLCKSAKAGSKLTPYWHE